MSVHGGLSAGSQVERMLQDGHSFERVEEFIQRQVISEEQKAALLLLAWAEADLRTRRRVIARSQARRSRPRSDERATPQLRAHWTRVA